MDKLFKIVFKDYPDWDKVVVLSDKDEDAIISGMRNFVVKAKDRDLYDLVVENRLRKKVFYDTYYYLNDTINRVKDALVELVNDLNE